MKKTIFKILAITVLIVGVCYIVYSNFGIKINSFRVGQQVNLFDLQNPNFGESEFNKKYVKNDSLIVLNLWATWCKPCIKEMPFLNSIKNKYSNQAITFLSLSIDKDSVKLNNFLNTGKFHFKDITFDNLEDRKAIINTLNGKDENSYITIQTVPKTYIIKNGKVLKIISGNVKNDFIESLSIVED